jgi:hypothetical protein
MGAGGGVRVKNGANNEALSRKPRCLAIPIPNVNPIALSNDQALPPLKEPRLYVANLDQSPGFPP